MRGKGFFLLFGIICLAIGIFAFVMTRNQDVSCTVATVAQVEYYDEVVSSNGRHGTSVAYHPVVSYEVDGVPYESRSNTGSGSQPYAIGEEVNIRYNPNDPMEFMIEGDKGGYIVGIVAIVVGLGAIAFAILGKNSGWHVSDRRVRGGGIRIDL